MSDMTNPTTGVDSHDNPSPFMEVDEAMIQDVLIKNGSNRSKKKIVGIVILVAVLAIAGWGLSKRFTTDAQGDYLTARVTVSTIKDTIETTGTLEPVRKSEMGFKNDGTIVALNVQPGDRVVKGQILAQQDSNTLKKALEQANITLTQTEISLKSAAMSYEIDQTELSKQEQLFEAGVISQSELDTARNDLRKSELELASAQAKLASDRAKVEQAQTDLEEATLVAPFDGIIGAVNGQVGQINGINSASSTLLTVMSQELQLKALVNEADIGRIKIGQDVEFTSTAFADQIFTGKVLRITPEAQTVSNVQFYPVLISCNDPENMLYSGMTVSANIIIQRAENVLSIPMMAVSYARTYVRQNPEALGARNNPSAPSPRANNEEGRKSGEIDSEANANSRPAKGEPGANPALREKGQGVNPQPIAGDQPQGSYGQETTNKETEGNREIVVVMENGKPVVKPVKLGMSNGSVYQVIDGLKEDDEVIVGSNTIANNSDAGSTFTNPNSNRQNQRGGMGGNPGGMGGPPPGF
jgi:HlyD family secretion protein